MKSVYIVEDSDNWILKYIGDDISRGLQELGHVCHKGSYENYKDEDVCLQMWWRYAIPQKKAKHNSIFITHTDDRLKEDELIRIKDQFDSYLCMSPEDGLFLVEIGYDKTKVFGINLPVRNTYIRPFSLGIFSSCYPDNRKNEQWLLDYCKSHPDSRLINFVFIGKGWGSFVGELEKLGCSFEWHNADRHLPCEYFFQQSKLQNLDCYLYMGMDGGAMGSYDAYAMGVDLCISDDGYHKGIPDINHKFLTKLEFDVELDLIIGKQRRRIDFFKENSIVNYSKKISSIFENSLFENSSDLVIEYSVRKKRRDNYFPINYTRIRATLSSFVHSQINKYKYGKIKNKDKN